MLKEQYAHRWEVRVPIGLSSLREDASKCLSSRDRVWPKVNSNNPFRQVMFGGPRLSSGVKVTPMWIGESEWGRLISAIQFLCWETTQSSISTEKPYPIRINAL